MPHGTSTKSPKYKASGFIEYLKRVMLHAAPLFAPQDVAWFLASYARDAKARIEAKARAGGGELPALANVRTVLEQALGIKFEGEKASISSALRLCKRFSTACFRLGCSGARNIPPRISMLGSIGTNPHGRCASR